ncbi:MAG: DNA repair protein RecO (recombination protein O) [Parcubacteria group bacterium Greene0714_21]|nr:MAG: DNA repair protein RecO (recombination protein O) [Parcubacteria group bacterium Greene0416_39]TSC97342.1 MAG: DNA repair protein RecO (recombination protein O) [Parcubacteria group bacterium Greene1014_47]TSD03932.1 MAG: DNA repair protein RecO (recombination protein O) [Parcubacteria group bacterium Greene0714_21]
MAVHYRTEGIVLATRDRGEADRSFTIYTKDFGKLEVWAISERKITSKLRGGLEKLCWSEIEFINGKSRKTLTDSSFKERYHNIRKNLQKLRVATRMAETLDETTSKEERDEAAWLLLLESFSTLGNLQFPAASCKLLYYYFFWNLFSHLGWRPNLASYPFELREILQSFLAKNTSVLYTLQIEKGTSKALYEAARSHYLSVIKEVQ